MSAETTTSSTTPASGHVTIVFTSDWGVSTGVGHAGRTHSKIERCGDDPVVRGTVITGVLREQAMLAARALDGPEEGKWTSFALWLFGQDPDGKQGSVPHPRHVLFSDATPASPIHIHDTVSLSIDPQTGTARDQFLRFTERAAAGVLTGTFTLIEEAGAEISDQRTIDAAHFLLGVAGLMVRGIGSGRSGGDGECMVAVSDKDYTKTDLRKEEAADALTRILANQDNGDSPTYSSADVKTVAGHLRNSVRESFQKVPDLPKDLSKNSPQDIAILNSQQSESGDTTWYATSLDIVLESPVVSYEVPFSNEVRSLDFLRGTVLVPWLHGLLRKNYQGNALVNSAIVSGDLRISDALPVYEEVAGLPVPFVLENEKVHEDELEDKRGDKEPCTLFNRHIPVDDQVCGDHTSPTRGCYLFVKSSGTPVEGWIGKPSLIGRQSTAINSETGAAKDGQLFLVRALPAGLTLRASIVVSKQLLSELRGTDATPVASPLTLDLGIAEQLAFLGSRKLTGTFGRARCTVGSTFTRVGSTPPPVEGPVTDEGPQASSSEHTEVVSLWFTSDVLARSSALGPGGSVEDLELAFRRANVPVTVVQESPDQDSGDKNRKRILTAIRHRRVDSWSPRDNAPRATRLAIQAGSVVQVRISPDDLGALETLGHIGVGELTPQGYGRFLVDSPLLAEATLPLFKTKRKSFTAPTEAVS
ncbi:MAG: CRISPR-associated protein [Actinomyces sp.]|uniref:RAMP superfamily CRISPR-associated protein n=1 Tax=Pauljensenia sp. UMB3104 TaxID=3046331 RepID=UPI00254FBA56|nr:RAMP superfamily CRISPR-associated protein [Pauljensenia sp. UMB3104]MDK7159895.1 CRISPR-associated protein [Pauljensenia sp. UMB3104]MDU5163927.1 CRISPR-associated protein [Actinomyces sp.]